MKKTIALLAFLSTASLFAQFDFKFECFDQYDGSPVMQMDVSASGIGNLLMSPSYSGVPMRVSSQYADYGSIVVAIAEDFSGVERYQLHLDFAAGDRWVGELRDAQGDFTNIACYDRL